MRQVTSLLACGLVAVAFGVMGRSAMAQPDPNPGPPPAPGLFWVTGYYVPADGKMTRPVSGPEATRGLTWHPGFWASQQPGWTWHPYGWVRSGNEWHFQHGAWTHGSANPPPNLANSALPEVFEPTPRPTAPPARRTAPVTEHSPPLVFEPGPRRVTSLVPPAAPDVGATSDEAAPQVDYIPTATPEELSRMTDAEINERIAHLMEIEKQARKAAAITAAKAPKPPEVPQQPVSRSTIRPASEMAGEMLRNYQIANARSQSYVTPILNTSISPSASQIISPTGGAASRPMIFGSAYYVGNSSPGSSYPSVSQVPTGVPGSSYYVGQSGPGSSYPSVATAPASPAGSSFYVGNSSPGSSYPTVSQVGVSVGGYGYGTNPPGVTGGQVGGAR